MEVAIDFPLLLERGGIAGQFDPGSLRVVERADDGSGREVPFACRPEFDARAGRQQSYLTWIARPKIGEVGAYDIYFDTKDRHLEAREYEANLLPPENLLANHGFEDEADGLPDGWTVTPKELVRLGRFAHTTRPAVPRGGGRREDAGGRRARGDHLAEDRRAQVCRAGGGFRVRPVGGTCRLRRPRFDRTGAVPRGRLADPGIRRRVALADDRVGRGSACAVLGARTIESGGCQRERQGADAVHRARCGHAPDRDRPRVFLHDLAGPRGVSPGRAVVLAGGDGGRFR